MPVYLSTFLTFAGAALAEIAGCFAFWAWLRNGHSVWWLLPGIASLIAFAWALTLAPSEQAGRSCFGFGRQKGTSLTFGILLAEAWPCWQRR